MLEENARAGDMKSPSDLFIGAFLEILFIVPGPGSSDRCPAMVTRSPFPDNK